LKKGIRQSTFREYIEAILVAVVIALFLRAFVIEAFKIPTSSMVPTLKIGDHIFVNKFIYGLRIPFTKIHFFQFRTPKRGEVVVFNFPIDESKDYIKRVIGIPGDTIEIKQGILYINGEAAEKVIETDRTILADVEEADQFELYKEKTGEIRHFTQYERNQGFDDYGPTIIPPNKFFVMGDNRNRSSDSRSWRFVPMENLKGRALIVWLSLDSKNRYPIVGLPSIRLERFGKLIR
jgi:signal peptidase I